MIDISKQYENKRGDKVISLEILEHKGEELLVVVTETEVGILSYTLREDGKSFSDDSLSLIPAKIRKTMWACYTKAGKFEFFNTFEQAFDNKMGSACEVVEINAELDDE